MKALLDAEPLSEDGLGALEEMFRDYGAEELQEAPYVASRLRRLPPRWAAAMFSIREHAKVNSRRWKRDTAASFRGEHSPGLHEERVEFVEPDVHSKNNGGGRFACAQCDGVRWMRMVNHMPDAVEVETSNARITHLYEPGESYLVPCEKCSPRRGQEYRYRKPLKGKDEAPDRRKPKTIEED